MKLTSASLSIFAVLFLSGRYSMPVYYEAPVPQASVGAGRDDAGWRPYSPPVPERRPDGEWKPRNPDWGAETRRRPDRIVRRDVLPEVSPDAERDRRAAEQAQAERKEEPFTRALPKDPPSDPTRRRTYSSRPDRNAELNKDVSAFGNGERPPDQVEGACPQGNTLEWADKAVRADNRPGFDRMVSQSSRLGKGKFEDEAGRVYFGESRGSEDGRTVVEVTVTTNGGLPVVSRGLAYDCR